MRQSGDRGAALYTYKQQRIIARGKIWALYAQIPVFSNSLLPNSKLYFFFYYLFYYLFLLPNSDYLCFLR